MTVTLSDRLTEYGYGLDGVAISLLDAFVELLREYGKRFNLVGRLDRAFLEKDLVCSSLELLRLALPSGTVVDVGSGAGFPGIPLAIAAPDAKLVLVETRKKRVAFLEQAVRKLELKNVVVRHEDAHKVRGERFDWAVARAFAPPQAWLGLARGLTRDDGRVCVYSTREAWAQVDAAGWALEARVQDRTKSNRIVVCLRKTLEDE